MNISAVPNRTVNTELDELTPLVLIKPQGKLPNSNLVTGQEPKSTTPNASSQKPTDGLREETKPTPTHADIQRMAEERAQENPEYRETLEKLAQCEGLIEKFLQIDSIGLAAGDQAITGWDLMVLINDVNQPNKAAREAAKFLNDNKWLWAEIAGKDGRAGLHDVKNLIQGLKARRDELKSQALADVSGELGVPQRPPAGAPSTSQAQQPASTPPGVDIPRPPPSARPGMEGAMDNLANVGDWLSQQMMALAQKAAAEPEKATLYQQQIAMLQNQYQAISNMMNQLTQTMSNLSKMWSDVAMNSIRNIK